MNIEGVFIPTFYLAWFAGSVVGMLIAAWSKAWEIFALLLGLGFIAGLTIYFKLLNV